MSNPTAKSDSSGDEPKESESNLSASDGSLAGDEEATETGHLETQEGAHSFVAQFNAKMFLLHSVLPRWPSTDRIVLKQMVEEVALALRELVNCDPFAAIAAIRDGVAPLHTSPSGDTLQRGVESMIDWGLLALCGDPDAERVATQFDAFLQGTRGYGDALKIRAIASLVRDSVALRKEPVLAKHNAELLLRSLESIDSRLGHIAEQELEDLLDSYVPKDAHRGQRTVRGIVADILMKTQALGTIGKTREQVVRRVDSALRVKGSLFNSTS